MNYHKLDAWSRKEYHNPVYAFIQWLLRLLKVSKK